MAHIEDRWQRPERKGKGKRWRARYVAPDGRERSASFDRRVDAQAFLATAEVKKLDGSWTDPAAGRETFGSYARRLLESRRLAPASRRRYETNLLADIYPVLEHKPLKAITSTDVRLVQKRMLERGLGERTAFHIYGLMAGILADAVADGLIGKSPCNRRLAPEKPARTKPTILTVEHVQNVAAEMPERFRPAVWLGAGCGLRVGEVLGLRLHRVRFLQRELDVAKQLQLLPGAPPVERDPKYGSSRTVALPDVVAEAIAAFLEQFPQPDPQGFVLRSGRYRITEKPVWPNTFNDYVWRGAVKRAGLPERTRFHELRHFYASALIQAGESVKSVQEALGHKSAVETLETYAGLWPDSTTRARSAVDGLLGRRQAESILVRRK